MHNTMSLQTLLVASEGMPVQQLAVFALLTLGMLESLANGLLSATEALGVFFHAENCLYSILKFFQVDIIGMFRMTSSTRYFKEGVGSSRPNWRWIMCFLERPKANTSCKVLAKRFILS